MLKKLRMGQIMNVLWILLVMLALCGFVFYKMGPGVLDMVKGATELTEEKDLEDMVGEYVTWTVKYPLGEYMETMTTTKVNGVSTGTKKSNSSWIVIDEEREILMSVEVQAKRYDEIDRQSDLFYQAENETDMTGEGVTVTGTLEVLSGEELGYFREAAKSVGLPIDSVVYHIGDGVIRGEKMVNTLGMFGIGLVLFIIIVFVMIKMMKNSPKKLIGQYIEKHPSVTMEHLESDFNAAENVNKVWIGKRWTFSSKIEGFMLDNNDVVWVHTETVRSGRSVNFYVWWNLIDGSAKSVSLSSEKGCKEVMEKYNRFAHILVGNNPEYGYLLKNDREKLLDIKYRANSPQ
ncbi:MAG: hypothetical protein K2H31_05020 [Lachnospiraceae bacterium]|nr:hypothetical protein [Lachnospiraceae bacterium]